MKNPKKLRILLSTFVCHPEKGSEEDVGWNWLIELSKNHYVYAMISDFLGQDEAIMQAILELPHRDNIEILWIPFPPKTNKLLTLFPLLEFYAQCVEWQKEVLSQAEKLLDLVEIDIVHHITYSTWTVPSYLWKLPKPFVLGPVSGSQRIPLEGYCFLTPKGWMKEIARMALYFWARRPLSPSKRAVKKASVILCSNLETLDEISMISQSSLNLLMPDAGINKFNDLILLEKYNNYDNHTDVNLFWAGVFEARKNFGLLLDALAILPADIQWNLLAAGEGEFCSYWKKRVVKLGLESKVTFLGKVPYKDMAKYYCSADIFVFPSLREGTPTVLLEAISFGVPVISLNLSGAKAFLSEDCSLLVNIDKKSKMINDFANAIEILSRNSALRERLANNAYKKLKEIFHWNKKANIMSSLYEEIIQNDVSNI